MAGPRANVERLSESLSPPVRRSLLLNRRVPDTTLRDALRDLRPEALRPALHAVVREAAARKVLGPALRRARSVSCVRSPYSAHHFANLPWVIAGSGGGYLKQGQHIDLTGGGGNLYDFDREGISHNRLLLTFLNAVGVPQEEFGDPEFARGQGEISELKA